MEFNFFLWPMVLPLLIPLFYCIKNKKDTVKDILILILATLLIIIFYWPLTMTLTSPANIYVKMLLFALIPYTLIIAGHNLRKKPILSKEFGLQKRGLKSSLKLGIILLPIMLLTTSIIRLYQGIEQNPDVVLAVISFIESFSEEFFFRGLLFLYLAKKTNLPIAYITSFLSFILMHPQHLNNLFILSTIIQAIITLHICQKTKNIAGAWLIHGSNRILSIAILPFLF